MSSTMGLHALIPVMVRSVEITCQLSRALRPPKAIVILILTSRIGSDLLLPFMQGLPPAMLSIAIARHD